MYYRFCRAVLLVTSRIALPSRQESTKHHAAGLTCIIWKQGHTRPSLWMQEAWNLLLRTYTVYTYTRTMRSSSDLEGSARIHLPRGVTNVAMVLVARLVATRSERSLTMGSWLLTTFCLALWSQASAQQTYYGWVDFSLDFHSVLRFGNDANDSRSRFRLNIEHTRTLVSITDSGYQCLCWIYILEIKDICIFYNFSKLKWRNQLKFFRVEDKDFVLHG